MRPALTGIYGETLIGIDVIKVHGIRKRVLRFHAFLARLALPNAVETVHNKLPCDFCTEREFLFVVELRNFVFEEPMLHGDSQSNDDK